MGFCAKARGVLIISPWAFNHKPAGFYKQPRGLFNNSIYNLAITAGFVSQRSLFNIHNSQSGIELLSSIKVIIADGGYRDDVIDQIRGHSGIS